MARPSEAADRLIVALDVGDVKSARRVVTELSGVTDFF